jgi:cyanophycinase
VIGGTSAGAAVMSSVMITGEELVNKDTINVFNMITKGNIKTAMGFGLLNNAIVDQHFIKRKRMNRLISLVLENPNLIGIGIDESTAIITDPSGNFEVLGESLVMVFDVKNAKEIKLDKNNHQAAKNIKLHLLKSGDRYSLSNPLNRKR